MGRPPTEFTMHCFDCTENGSATTAGIGACTGCGLFVCRDHARVVGAGVQRPVGVVPRTSPVAARRLVCATCRTAEIAR
ncbi:DUF2180 family protein [Streptomyces sp. NPDC059766]|uniref:DUF2180 family protein n=1 Tax=Streptomyces sp. NPDC059766 TaxID=3346940 RepID=UPI0036662527